MPGPKLLVSPAPSRSFLAVSSALVVIAGLWFGATIATANSVQVQSYERANQTDTCDNPPESLSEWRAAWADPNDPISGPTWHPTWEQWANNGKGGWTCTRSVTWARTSTAAGSSTVTYALGDIGPGGGLVFLISGGLTYEMAPKSWSGGVTDPTSVWCNVDTRINGAVGTAVSTGAANTTAMLAVCASGAGNLSATYRGGGFDDWFLPSQDELNAMCNYSRNPESPALPSVSCRGSVGTNQDAAFASEPYGFAASDYRTSTQAPRDDFAFFQNFRNGGGDKSDGFKSNLSAVRPIRAF